MSEQRTPGKSYLAEDLQDSIRHGTRQEALEICQGALDEVLSICDSRGLALAGASILKVSVRHDFRGEGEVGGMSDQPGNKAE